MTRAIRLLEPPAPPSPDIPERDFQALILDLATTFGWAHQHQHDSRKSDPGWPDLVLARPPRLLFREVKAARGRVGDDQAEWGYLLTECGQDFAIWRPADWPAIVATLTEDRR